MSQRGSTKPKPSFLKGLMKWIRLCQDRINRKAQVTNTGMIRGSLKEASHVLQTLRVIKTPCTSLGHYIWKFPWTWQGSRKTIFPKVAQGEMGLALNLLKKETSSVMKISPEGCPDASLAHQTEYFREKPCQDHASSFRERDKRSTIFIPKPDQWNTRKESHTPISL